MARIILLTQPECAEPVARPLMAAGAQVDMAFTRDALTRALAGDLTATRLISFGAGIIVPAAMLNAMPGPSYNLHPGPPAYPGLFPSVYALYDRQENFGITLHEMAAEVDSGPIIATETFAIPQPCDRVQLDTLTFAAMLRLIGQMAGALANVARALPRSERRWSGQLCTRADFTALCDVPEDADAAEFQRRLRAVGEGPNHALTVTRFGRRFRLASDTATPVTRGGQPTVR